MRLSRTVAVAVLLCSVVAIPSWADHDDSTLRGLRVTVGSVNPGTGDVAITVTATGVDSSTFRSTHGLFLGSQFKYDGDVYTLVSPRYPAIDWGDGSTIGATHVTLTSTTAGINGGPRYKRQFSHTYGTAGVFTIRAFGYDVYQAMQSPLYGNAVTAATWLAHSSGSSTDTFTGDEEYPGGVSASTAVTITAVPAMQRTGLATLALMLALTGAALLLFKRS